MLCQHCGKNEANRHYHMTAQGKTTETHLCTACAQETGFDAEFQKNIPFAFPAFLPGFPTAPPPSAQVCPLCGSSFGDIQQSGKAGCAQCYGVFSAAFLPFIRRVHGAGRHVGRLPSGASEQLKTRRRLVALRQQLAEAIEAQAFEQAATLRDEIRALEGGASQ